MDKSAENRNDSVLARTRAAILAYVSHLEDVQFVEAVFADSGMSVVTKVLSEIIRDSQLEQANAALSFTFDVGLNYFAPAQLTADFRKSIVSSELFAALRDGLHFPAHVIRSNVISILGRLQLPDTLSSLQAAFDDYLTNDPLLLNELVREIFWLMCRRDWRYVERMATDKNWIVRWSAVELVSHKGGSEGSDYELEKKLMQMLCRDPSPLVRAEARYCSELSIAAELPRPNKLERRRIRKLIEREFNPKMTFFEFKHRFFNGRLDVPDYKPEDVEAFAERFIAGDAV